MAKGLRTGGSKKGKPLLASTPDVMASAISKRANQPMILTGNGTPRLVTIEPSQFPKLGVDESYQRVRLTSWVNTLIHMIAQGGFIPDPITVAERLDGSLWIVDGQQRFCAHLEMKRPIRALIYKVTNIESEKGLFLVMNNTKKVGPNYIVHSWPGKSGQMIREANANPHHSLFGRVSMGASGAKIIDAGSLARGIYQQIGTAGQKNTVPMQECLNLADTFLADNAAMERRAKGYLDLCGTIFNGAIRMRLLPAISLARVAYEYWGSAGHVKMPTAKEMSWLRRINWGGLCESSAMRYLPMVDAEIKRKWLGYH